DHAGNAVSALRSLLVDKSLLHDPGTLPCTEPLYGRDVPTGDVSDGRLAGEHRRPVHDYRTGSALSEAAPELRAVELERIAKHVQQGCAGIVVDFDGSAVYDERGHHSPAKSRGPAQKY